MRLFVAVDLDERLKVAVARATDGLRRTLQPLGVARAVRWVAPAQLHLTLRFLGEVEADQGSRVREVLAPPLECSPFELAFGGAGVFPPRGAPRVLWVGLRRGVDELRLLFEAVETRVRAAGLPPESRPFAAHLTLGRCRDVGRWSTRQSVELRAALGAIDLEIGVLTVSEAVLYRSQLSPAGPRYEPLLRTTLAGGRP